MIDDNVLEGVKGWLLVYLIDSIPLLHGLFDGFFRMVFRISCCSRGRHLCCPFWSTMAHFIEIPESTAVEYR